MADLPDITADAWPDGDAFIAWMAEQGGQVGSAARASIPGRVNAATAKVIEQIDVDKLPEEGVPLTVVEAIFLEAARLLYRRSSPHGAIRFGDDLAVRLSSVDVDVEALLEPWRLDPEP